MKLYHFTTREYSVGEKVTVPQGVSAFSYSNETEKKQKTIDCFDEYVSQKYPDYVSRKQAVYAFDDAKYAKHFGHGCKGRIYIIEMDVSYKGPMVLVNRLEKELGNKEREIKVLEEYFEPKHAWKEYEYLGKNFVVIKELDENIIENQDYMVDYDLDKKVFEPTPTWAEKMKTMKSM